MQTTLPYPDDAEEFPTLLYLSDVAQSDCEVVRETSVLEHCAACGVMLVAADTSPRGDAVPDDERFDMGIGASYYVNATEEPWRKHFRMLDYLQTDLLEVVHKNFPTCGPDEVSVMGHGMGGMCALAMATRSPDMFRSVSAVTPISHPVAVPEGASPDVRRAFSIYLGEDEAAWRKYDPSYLIDDCSLTDVKRLPPFFVDVGSETMQSPMRDVYRPFDFMSSCHRRGVPIEFRIRAGFDHTFFFITSVMEEHLDFHSKHLDAP